MLPSSMKPAVALLAAAFAFPTLAQNSSSTAPTEAELHALHLFWDYGRSPPFYPSPVMTGTDEWATAYAQAKTIVARMSNEEKQNITIGYASTTNGCSGTSPGVDRLGYSGMCLQDAGNGVRGMEGTSGYPSGLHVGASWNMALAQQRGYYLGAEFKAKGVNMALGPVVGPLGRHPTGGRNWEGASNDPYLAGQLASVTISGMQENVIACTKHFIVNEQETNRNPSYNFVAYGVGAGTYNESVSSNLDDKTMHELYLWPFQDAVRAGAGSIMCSYNRINNSYGCANSYTMNNLLKTELGFQGMVVSDWFAQHTGVASAEAGLDMVMPISDYWGNLTIAVNNGTMQQSRLDDMATRILATWYRFSPLTNPGFGIPINLTAPHKFTNARTDASKPTIFQGALEGHVLVKNTDNALPLKTPEILSIFGYDAVAPRQYTPASMKWSLGDSGLNINESGIFPLVLGIGQSPAIELNGTMWVGGGSGANTPPFVSDPFSALSAQAQLDNTWLTWDFDAALPTVDPASDACLVFINAFSTEGSDRLGLSDDYSDNLVNHVASQCNNTMVIIHNAGVRIVDGFYDNENVTAIIYAHLPGQQSGNALVELLYGRASFSGRMPYTVAKKASDYGNTLNPTRPDANSHYFTQSNFTEGVYIDYRGFQKNNITPRFAFGYGLTYSNFSYSALSAALSVGPSALTALPAPAKIISGGNPNLFQTLAVVSATITNTGSVVAAEVAQLYIGIPNSPAMQLRGFVKESLNPGQGAVVSFALDRRDLSVWDTVQQQWVLQSGTYNVYVGKSVEDVQLKSTLKITVTGSGNATMH